MKFVIGNLNFNIKNNIDNKTYNIYNISKRGCEKWQIKELYY